jgi:hypothetical protein
MIAKFSHTVGLLTSRHTLSAKFHATSLTLSNQNHKSKSKSKSGTATFRVQVSLTISDPMSDLVQHYDFPVPDAFPHLVRTLANR